jgi:hypothetical protein
MAQFSQDAFAKLGQLGGKCQQMALSERGFEG